MFDWKVQKSYVAGMDILDLIYNRRTVHAYTNAPVPKDVLLSGLRAATYAPNHKLTWPWRFFILGSSSRKILADIQVNNKRKKQELSDVAAEALRQKFLTVGELLLVGIMKSEDPVQAKEDYAALSAGLQNMSLYFWGQGYGTKWTTGGLIKHPEVQKLVPENIEICGLFWIGKAQVVPVVSPRPELNTFVQELP